MKPDMYQDGGYIPIRTRNRHCRYSAHLLVMETRIV
jgi:hypothetical protein